MKTIRKYSKMQISSLSGYGSFCINIRLDFDF
jgi:hypothetical protein